MTPLEPLSPIRQPRPATFLSLSLLFVAGTACTANLSNPGGNGSSSGGSQGSGGSGNSGNSGMSSGSGGSGPKGSGGSSGSGGSGNSTSSGGQSGSDPNGTGSGGSGGQPPMPLDCSQRAPGPAPIRRLTRFEYSNTMRDLLGDTTAPGDLLPAELKGNGFSNDATSITTPRLLVDAYQSVAHDIAARATMTASALTKTTGCDTTKMSEDACAQAFVTSFGGKAFRRPLDSTESSAILGVYKAIRPASTYADGNAAVIEMVLQSPQFLYKPELGTAMTGTTTVARVTGYEMATRLSYLFWGTMPDQTLLDAAKGGKLDSADQVKAQAQKMLDDPRTKDVLHFFHDTWLGISGIDGTQKDATWFKTYDPSLATLFRQETEQFMDYVVFKGNGDLASMFNAPFTFLNAKLSKFYGFGNVTGDAFQMVATDGKQRGGLLSQSSLLMATTPGAHNNPVVRGKFIYTQLLCGTVLDPPAGIMFTEPDPDSTQTVREVFVAHRTNPGCAGCHMKLDPIGFGLEHFNGVGLWQDQDNGKAVDSTGVLPDTDIAGAFDGAVELGKKLAGSKDARNCYAGKWLAFGYGRVETAQDACNRQSLQDAFSAANGNIKQLLVALTQTDAFLYRPVAQP